MKRTIWTETSTCPPSCASGAGEKDFSLPLRPDHGHRLMHELEQHVDLTPGYSAIGRMRGLAELRGIMHGLRAVECRAGRAPADEGMPG